MSIGYVRNETTMMRVDIELDDSFIIQNSMHDCLFTKNTDIIRALKSLDHRYDYQVCIENADEDDKCFAMVNGDPESDIVNVYIQTRVVEEFLLDALKVNIEKGNKVGIVERPYDEDTCCPFCGGQDIGFVMGIQDNEIMNCHDCREDFIGMYV